MNRLTRTVARVDLNRTASIAAEAFNAPVYRADTLRSFPRRTVALSPVFETCPVLNLTPSAQVPAAPWKEVM